MKKTLQEILRSPIMHDSQRKELALKYIAANPHTTHQEVADKYLLEKNVIQEMKGGLKKYGYYAGDILVLTEYI